MARSKHVQRFLRAADERLVDAELLLSSGRTTGAIYLAGYAAECGIKALILSQVPLRGQSLFIEERFRGAWAHDYDLLLREYHIRGGAAAPEEIRADLLFINTWEVARRYEPGQAGARDARDFLDAFRRILDWAKERLR